MLDHVKGSSSGEHELLLHFVPVQTVVTLFSGTKWNIHEVDVEISLPAGGAISCFVIRIYHVGTMNICSMS